MSQMKQMAQFVFRVVAGLVSLVVMLALGLVAFGAIIMTSLAVVLRIKWLQRKFEKQNGQNAGHQQARPMGKASQHDINAVKTEEGTYSVSGA